MCLYTYLYIYKSICMCVCMFEDMYRERERKKKFVLQIFTSGHCQNYSRLQHTATHYNTLRHCNIPQHTATHCNTLQYTTTVGAVGKYSRRGHDHHAGTHTNSSDLLFRSLFINACIRFVLGSLFIDILYLMGGGHNYTNPHTVFQSYPNS